MRVKTVIFVEAVIIIFLLTLLVFQYFSHRQDDLTDFSIPVDSLISPRVYAGIIEPKSYLILNFVPLKEELQNHIQNNNLTMSVYLVNLRDGASMSINSNRAFAPASLSKVPLAVLILRKVEEGKITLDTLLKIENADRDSSSGLLYQSLGKSLPLRVLLEEMLVKSDNTAFRVLMRYLEEHDWEVLYDYWDYFSKDSTISNGDKEGLVTPRSVYNVFLSLYLSTVLESEHSEYLLSLLADSSFDLKEIAQLPPQLRVAHKYAVREDKQNNLFHDCGIMYPQEMKFFYCVMTADNSNQTAGIEEVGYAVNKIYNYVLNTRKSLDGFKENNGN